MCGYLVNEKLRDGSNGAGWLEWEGTPGGGLETGSHHLLCNDATVEWNDSRLLERSTDEIGGKRLHMCLSIDGEEVGLLDFLAFALKVGTGCCQLALQDTEDNNIKSLKDMGTVRRVAEDVDVMFACVVEEGKCEV